jgi:hypothetical protein
MSKADYAMAEFHRAMISLLQQEWSKEQVILLVKLADKFKAMTEHLRDRENNGN